MKIPDLVTMLGNISQSLYPVQRLVTGFAYLFGIFLFCTAIVKFKAIGEKGSTSQGAVFGPVVYALFGAALLYIPTTMETLANTAFGTGNVLTYVAYNRYDIYSTIGLFVRTAGVIWFVRGCILVAAAGQPGSQEGPKGILFMVAGIMLMNFDNTIAATDYIVNHIISWSMQIKLTHGY